MTISNIIWPPLFENDTYFIPRWAEHIHMPTIIRKIAFRDSGGYSDLILYLDRNRRNEILDILGRLPDDATRTAYLDMIFALNGVT
jgi:hypothetical protein